MSAAAATADASTPKRGNKKLIIIIAAVAVLLLGGGGAAVMVMKGKAADAAAEDEEGGDGKPKAKAAKKADPKALPVFSPLDMFTVNLADRETERYAQVGITLEMDAADSEARLKALMPAVRNQILLAIGDRKAEELASREGKAALALRIRLDASRVLGAEFEDADFGVGAPAADAAADEEKPAKGKKAKKRAEPDLPVVAVHFSNFIIQ